MFFRVLKTNIAINCGGIPENLLESELFGYKKGAFTGADRDKKGLFEDADHGTIFLDEIGEMLPFSLSKNNLYRMRDILAGKEIKADSFKLKPYQFRWLAPKDR